jgi:hypothetical protein
VRQLGITERKRNDRRRRSNRPIRRRIHPHAPDISAADHGAVKMNQDRRSV